MAEGHRRLSLVRQRSGRGQLRKKTESKRMAVETAENIRAAVELMDQTDIAEETVSCWCA